MHFTELKVARIQLSKCLVLCYPNCIPADIILSSSWIERKLCGTELIGAPFFIVVVAPLYSIYMVPILVLVNPPFFCMKMPPDHYRTCPLKVIHPICWLLVPPWEKCKPANKFEKHIWRINYSWLESAQFAIQACPTLNTKWITSHWVDSKIFAWGVQITENFDKKWLPSNSINRIQHSILASYTKYRCKTRVKITQSTMQDEACPFWGINSLALCNEVH